jgi:hypothetical protein
VTIADDNKYCAPCRDRGLKRKAHRIVIDGKRKIMMCDEDFRFFMDWPQLSCEALELVKTWSPAPVRKGK